MATKFKSASAAVNTSKVEDANIKGETAQPIVEDEAAFSFIEYARSMAAMAGVEIPTGRQMLAGTVVTLLVSFAGGYGAGAIAGYVFIGAALLTGSMFLAYLSMIITLVVGVYLAAIAGSRAGAYVATGGLEAHAMKAKNWVTGLIGSSKAKLSVAAS